MTINNQAATLFSTIYGTYFESQSESDPMAYIPLAWRAPGQGGMHTEFYASIDEATCRVDDFRLDGVEAFFGVAPRRRYGSEPRLLKRAIPHVLTLHVDIDGKNSADERRLKRQRPTVIVNSGSKFHSHGYFILDCPLPTKTHGQLAYELNKELAELVGGDLNATDISRSLRVPGTLHLKNPSKPQPVEIVEVNEVFSFDSLMERFGRNIRNPSADTVRRVLSRKPNTLGSFVTPEQRPIIDSLLQHGLTEPHSREAATMLLIRDCYGKGMIEEEIIKFVIGFFEHNHNNLSDDWREQPNWCRANVRAKVKNWLAKAYTKPGCNSVELSANDLKFIDSKATRKWDRQFLQDALKFILVRMTPDRTVFLSSRIIQTFKGANSKNYRRRLKLLLELGILELKERASKSKRLATVYRVVYESQTATPAREAQE
jgi:hypothetical protein